MPSFTLIIIALTCAASFVAFNNPKMIDAMILWPPAVSRKGEWWRLLSYGFIHADFMHLLFNMLTFFFFGPQIEGLLSERLGVWGFPVFYLVGLVVSILPTYLRNQNNAQYRSLGASGAVSAVLFAYILLQPWAIIGVFFIPMPAIVFAVLYTAYSIWMDKRGGDNVNHSAHLWGAAYGVIAVLLIEPAVFGHFLGELGNPRFGR